MNAARFLRALRMTEKISIFKSKISNSTFRISGSKYVEMKTKFSFWYFYRNFEISDLGIVVCY